VDPATGQIERIPLSEVISRKLNRLPEEAEQILNIVGVSGQALRLDEALKAADLDAQAASVVTRMRNEKLLRLSDSNQELIVDTYHDRIRSTVLSGIDTDRCRQLHLSLAQTIEYLENNGNEAYEWFSRISESEDDFEQEILVSKRIFDLTYHFDAAGDQQKALMYSLLAAKVARQQFALDVATEQYAIASRNAADSGEPVRYSIARWSGELLMLLGCYEDAVNQLHSAIDLTSDPVNKATIEALLGETEFKRGHLTQSIEFYESGLRRLGEWIPRTKLGLAFGILRETVIQIGHSLFPASLGKKEIDTRQHNLVVHLFSRLGHPVSFVTVPKMAWTVTAGLNRGELGRPSSSSIFATAFHGVLMLMMGWQSRGSRFCSNAIELAEKLNDHWRHAQALSYRGMSFYSSAQYQEGVGIYQQAVEGFASMGDLAEFHLANFHLGCCQYGLGHLTPAIELARATFDSSARVGDMRTHCSLYLWAKATSGNLPLDQLRSRIVTNGEDVLSTCNLDKAEGYWHLHHGRTPEAIESFRRGWVIPMKNVLWLFHSVAGLPPLAMALRLRANELKETDTVSARRLLKEALRYSRLAIWFSWLFPTERPAAYRELSQVYLVKGNVRRALRLARKSCQIAEKQSAAWELAQSDLLRAQLAQQLGMPNADEELQSAEREMSGFRAMIEEAISQETVLSAPPAEE
jgi:two-component system sensor kinase